MKVVIFGAGGILGQHMKVSQPDANVSYYRTTPWDFYKGVNLNSLMDILDVLNTEKPDVVLNLAGQNNVDEVQSHPAAYHNLNAVVPRDIATWCVGNESEFIQVSTQGVFSGENPPYSPKSQPDPITHYGRQKAKAEVLVRETLPTATIARMTFVLGVRPFPEIGRTNPLEQMFTPSPQLQVNDRWFSPAWAPDAAQQLWRLIEASPGGTIHIGESIRVSRWDIARMAYMEMYSAAQQGHRLTAISHNYFPGIAPRPTDTTWAAGSMHDSKSHDNIKQAYNEWKKLNGSRN